MVSFDFQNTMRKIFSLNIALIAFIFQSQAQIKFVDFYIEKPQNKIEKCRYNTIQYLDSRTDTTDYGFALKGGNNDKARVITKTPLLVQVADIFNAMKGNQTGNGELLFQVRRLIFSEAVGVFGSNSFCQIRLQLYSKDSLMYKKIAFVDTTLSLSGFNSTKLVLKECGNIIRDLIDSVQSNDLSGTQLYSSYEVKNINEVEKKSIPLYALDELSDGIYRTSSSFLAQKLDAIVYVEMEDGVINTVKEVDEEGAMKKVKLKDIFSIVYQGRPYIATKSGFSILDKRENDFYYKVSVHSANNAGLIAAALLLGVMGGFIYYETNPDKNIELKLDHFSGKFLIVNSEKRNDH